ncbi:MAG: hypothetical protein ABEJ22_09640, partial [Haloferacaceae archaeon]
HAWITVLVASSYKNRRIGTGFGRRPGRRRNVLRGESRHAVFAGVATGFRHTAVAGVGIES